VIFAIWTGFLRAVAHALMPVSTLPAALTEMASAQDTCGILNIWVADAALAATVVAIFMKAQQPGKRVETNNLYKQEVAAPLQNPGRQNAWLRLMATSPAPPARNGPADCPLSPVRGGD
jgi:hypothetical protein